MALVTQGTAKGLEDALLVVDGDPSTDVTLLADRSKLSSVISRGRCVDLDRPWPTRAPLPDERVASWARDILTRERAGLPGPMGRLP